MLAGTQYIDPNKVAVYIRWSTEEQGEGTTLDVQRDSCKHFLLSRSWNFRDDLVYVDDGWSGATLDRPAMTRLRAAVETGDVQCVVVYKLDRLSRSLVDTVNLVTKEWKHKAPLFSSMENFDTHSSLGELIFNILISFAQFERNTIRDRTMSGKAQRAAEGKWLGSHAPFGYSLVKREVTPGKTVGELQPNPDTAPLVRQMFEWSANGTSSVSVATRLNEMGVPSPSGGLWTVQTVLVILRNEVYRGRVVYGKTPAKRKYLRDEIAADGKHQPLIDEALWARVQSACAARSQMHPRSVGGDYAFSGLLECEGCGATMAGDRWKWTNKDGAQHVKVYRCRTRGSTGTCSTAKIQERDVEASFLTWAEQFLQAGGVRGYLQERYAKQQNTIAAAMAVRKQAEKRLEQVDTALQRLDRAYFETKTVDDDEYRTKKATYKQEREDITTALAEPLPVADVQDVSAITEHVRSLQANWARLDAQRKRAAVMGLTQSYGFRIVVRSNKVVDFTATA